MKLTVSQNLGDEAATKLRAKIKENGGYCLCSLVKDNDHRCGPCPAFLNDGEKDNVCHCGLYRKRIED